MAWNTYEPISTKHTCGGPVFGRKTKGCPRCDELIGGAEPKKSWTYIRDMNEALEREYRLEHRETCSKQPCGPVCTNGQW